MKVCPFCLNRYEKLTKEHIFPESWYPDSFSNNIEKWQVHSCKKCNDSFGKIEQDILIKVGMCSDPTSHQAKKAMRSIDSTIGRDIKDKRARWKKACDLLAELIPVNNLRVKPFPNFGPFPGYPIESQKAIPLPKGLDEIGKKFIKGVEYKLEKRFIDESKDKLKVYFCHEENIGKVNELIKGLGVCYDISPGIVFYRTEGKEKPKVGIIYKFIVWDKLIIYGSLFI
jgi:hypothetical protein